MRKRRNRSQERNNNIRPALERLEKRLYLSFDVASQFAVGGLTPTDLSPADFNGDGELDLGIAVFGSDQAGYLPGNGSGGFGAPSLTTVGILPRSISAGPVDSNGTTDFVVANQRSNNVGVVRVNRNGTLEPVELYNTDENCVDAVFADLDGDSFLDIVAANEGSDTLSVLKNRQDGTFSSAVSYRTGSRPWSVSVGDVNGDGKLDVLTTNLGSNNIAVHLGKSDGTLQPPTFVAVGRFPQSAILGEFNGDGKLDVAVANASDNNVSVLSGNGDGSFGASRIIAVGSNPRSIAAADFNGDGDLDLMTANGYGNSVSYIQGEGAGRFGMAVEFAVGTTPFSVAIGDWNSDGRLDAATANANSNDVSILLNRFPAVSAPEIEVRLASVIVVDGSTTPISFGAAQQNSGSRPLRFTISNQGDQPLSVGSVALLNNVGFRVLTQPATSVPSGRSTTFDIEMLTNQGGNMAANVRFTNGDADESPFDFKIAGSVTTDTTKPAVRLLSPNSGTVTVSPNRPIAIRGTANDESGISHVWIELYKDGEAADNRVGYVYQGSPGSGVPASIQWIIPATMPDLKHPGQFVILNGAGYKLKWIAWDTKGNPNHDFSDSSLTIQPAKHFIENVPDIMHNLGWTKSEALQRRWFNRDANAFADIDSTTIQMQWLLNYERAQTSYDLLFNPSSRNYFASKNAQTVLKTDLDRMFADSGAKSVNFGDFSKEGFLLHNQQIQYSPVKSRTLDDLAGSLGDFSLYAVPQGSATKNPATGAITVTISKVGVYAYDSFNFDSNNSLGYWALPNRVRATSQSGFTGVHDRDYRDYISVTGKGATFHVFSDPKVVTLHTPKSFVLK